MTKYTVPLLALIALSACGQESVRDHVDAVRRSGQGLRRALPAPWRLAEFGVHDPSVSFVRKDLSEVPSGRLLLEAGDAVVPDLVALLGDRERRRIAALLLAEIGGERAARALLKQWRLHRDQVVEGHPRLENGPFASEYSGPGADFYGEVLYGLAAAGKPVAGRIALDTRAAFALVERHVPPRRNATETAAEGLTILIMLGAPDAPSLVVRALESDVRALRWTALTYVPRLGLKDALPALDALVELLDDPEWHREAVGALADIYGEDVPPNADEVVLGRLAVSLRGRARQEATR